MVIFGVGEEFLELIDEDVGTHFQPADPDDLVDKVSALLDRPDLADTGKRARQRVIERWGLDRLIQRHIEIYETLLAERA